MGSDRLGTVGRRFDPQPGSLCRGPGAAATAALITAVAWICSLAWELHGLQGGPKNQEKVRNWLGGDPLQVIRGAQAASVFGSPGVLTLGALTAGFGQGTKAVLSPCPGPTALGRAPRAQAWCF